MACVLVFDTANDGHVYFVNLKLILDELPCLVKWN